jgi:choline transport protein
MTGDDIQKQSLNEKHAQDDFEPGEDIAITLDGEIVNASGHRDQLQRGYGLLSICGLALSVDNAWVALGTSLTIAICTSSARTNGLRWY